MSERFSWSKVKSTSFRSNSIFDLKRGDERHAVVQSDGNGQFFSYGVGRNSGKWNTHKSPMGLSEAKADALSRARAALQNEGKT